MKPVYRDRREAGQQLSKELLHYKQARDTLVLALARGGVPVANEIASTLNLPLDLLCIHKLYAPHHPDLLIGAVASDSVKIIDDDLVKNLHLTDAQLQQLVNHASKELQIKEKLYRGGLAAADKRNKTIILVDDGIASGTSMRTALEVVSKLEPRRIVVAVPSAAGDTIGDIRLAVDELVCLSTPEPYLAVKHTYQISDLPNDQDIQRILSQKLGRITEPKPQPSAPHYM